MRPNPLFDSYRTATAPNPVAGIEVEPDRWAFELPDSGFFFPGDVIHYYFLASDDAGGDIGTTLLPGDTTGFALFAGDPGHPSQVYSHRFTARALPSLWLAAPPVQPDILLWDDGGSDQELRALELALHNTGSREGVDYDIYRTQAAGSGVGNGLGARATADQLTGYETLIYTSAGQTRYILNVGSFDSGQDPSDDLGVLTAWLEQGSKSALFCGGELADDLNDTPETQDFLWTWLGAEWVDFWLWDYIEDQHSPLVVPEQGNTPGLQTEYVLFGGCPELGYFEDRPNADVVRAQTIAERILEFTDPQGTPGAYDIAAGVFNHETVHDGRLVFLPYWFKSIRNIDSESGDAIPARAHLLAEILSFFGTNGSHPPTEVPAPASFAVRCYPNPFNPWARIDYSLPARGRLTSRIYDVRGRLVKTLIDEIVEAGAGHMVWGGDDAGGRKVGAGIYFCETRSGENRDIQKLVLVR